MTATISYIFARKEDTSVPMMEILPCKTKMNIEFVPKRMIEDKAMNCTKKYIINHLISSDHPITSLVLQQEVIEGDDYRIIAKYDCGGNESAIITKTIESALCMGVHIPWLAYLKNEAESGVDMTHIDKMISNFETIVPFLRMNPGSGGRSRLIHAALNAQTTKPFDFESLLIYYLYKSVGRKVINFSQATSCESLDVLFSGDAREKVRALVEKYHARLGDEKDKINLLQEIRKAKLT